MLKLLHMQHPPQANILRIQCRYLSICSVLSVVFILLVRKYLPKSLKQTAASSRKIKAKQGADCFIFFANDPSLFSVLQKALRPECLHSTSPNCNLSPEFSALASRAAVRVLLAPIRSWGKTRNVQNPPAGAQAHPWHLKEWCFSYLENVLFPLLLSPPFPLKFLAGVGVIFPVHPRCFGICPSRARLGRGHSSWL